METPTFKKGQIISVDLTVEGAEKIRDFYSAVVGWQVENMPMKDGDDAYSDYVLKDESGGWVGGVCHHRGANKGIPSQWIVYVNVANIADSVKKCLELGGKVIRESKDKNGNYQYAMIQDPTGAILGLTSM
jgi:predicted enzyme related to lactoylglutathione lyase